MSAVASGAGPLAPEDAHRALAEIVRAAGRDVLATLARWTGNLALAEDAVQDASLRALQTWPRDGIPDNPVAWLRTTARRCAVDLIRRESARGPKEALAFGSLTDTVLPMNNSILRRCGTSRTASATLVITSSEHTPHRHSPRLAPNGSSGSTSMPRKGRLIAARRRPRSAVKFCGTPTLV